MLINKTGFTLIELIAVITILSILSVVTIIKIPDYTSSKLNIARDFLITDIKLVQNLAITQKKTFGIKFNSSLESYNVYQGAENYSNTINKPSTAEPYTIELSSKFPGIEILSTTLASEALQFDNDGIPYDSSGLLNTSKNIIIRQTSTGKEQIINIIPNTGLATGIQ